MTRKSSMIGELGKTVSVTYLSWPLQPAGEQEEARCTTSLSARYSHSQGLMHAERAS